MEPKVRFKGFSGEWNVYTIGDIAPVMGGYAFQSEQFSNSGIAIVRISNILDTGIIGGDFVKYDIFTGDTSFRLYSGDILIAMSGATTGKVAIVKTDKFLYQNQRVGKFSRTDKINYSFLASIVGSNKFRLELNKRLTSSAQPNASSRDIDSIQQYLPNDIIEQGTIASFFSSIDSTIISSAKKLASLKKLKSASLVTMFPQNGESTPKVRFKGFEGEWDKQSASDLFLTIDERNRPELPVLSACQDVRGMIPRDKIGFNVSHDTSNEVTYKRVQPGQFVIHLRSFQGGFAHSSYDGIISPAYTVFDFKNKEQHDDYYWKIVFMSRSFIERLRLITYGIRDGRSISFNEFKELSFLFPSKEEQQAIASFFRTLNRKIALETARLEKLKQIKLACLDKMFV